MKFYLYHMGRVFGVVCLLTGGVFAAPATHVQTFRPSTQTGVMQPGTSVTVRQQSTAVAVDKPATSRSVVQQETAVSVRQNATSVTVNKQDTSVAVNKLTTTVPVHKPATNVSVTHPGEPDWQTATRGYSNVFAAPQTADTSKDTPSMMSSYQPPKAKDFKAAALGKGEEGLGNKVDEAEKDAAAAALNIPKAEEASFENVMKSDGKTSGLKKAVEKEIKK